jgi:hypothetical protein
MQQETDLNQRPSGFLGTFTAQPKNSAFGGASKFLI